MRILCIDREGAALNWCMRCIAAGHELKHFIQNDEKWKWIGRGLTDRVDDWVKSAEWADLIFVVDNIQYIHQLDQFRASHPRACVVAPSVVSREWETDRKVGAEVLRKAGVKTLPYQEFGGRKGYDEAISYVLREGKRFVSKPSGEASKALSYVSKTPEDMIYMLKKWKRADTIKDSFILQEFMPGVEMAVGGWFGPGGFNEGFCENFEFKKLMVGDLGVATGEMGTVIRYVRRSKLASKVLLPVEAALTEVGYVGYVDVNCIIDEAGMAWPLEFTMRCGDPTFNIQQPLHRGDPAEWMLKLCRGEDAYECEYDTVCVGVLLAIPDFPYSHITRREVVGVPVYGLTDKMMEHIHPCEMMAGTAPRIIHGKLLDAPCLVTAGDQVLVATGTGESVREAARRAYATIKKLVVPNSPMYRNDIGKRLQKQLPLIQQKGYALGMTY